MNTTALFVTMSDYIPHFYTSPLQKFEEEKSDIDSVKMAQEIEKRRNIKNELRSQFQRSYDGDVESVFDFIVGECDDIQHAKSISRKIINRDIIEDELGFLLFLVEEELDSASKDGITIIDHLSSFEIRNNGNSKIIDGELYTDLKTILGEDEGGGFEGELQNIEIGNSSTINVKSGGSISGGVDWSTDTVKEFSASFEAGEKIEYQYE